MKRQVGGMYLYMKEIFDSNFLLASPVFGAIPRSCDTRE